MSLFTLVLLVFFFFNDTATTEIYTLSLHDALPISSRFLSCWFCHSTKSLNIRLARRPITIKINAKIPMTENCSHKLTGGNTFSMSQPPTVLKLHFFTVGGKPMRDR